MKQFVIFASFIFVFYVPGQSQQVEVKYKTYCGGCHGARMEGGTAPALVKTKWQHGSTSAAIFRNIKYGIQKTEMRGWSKALNDKDIRAITSYIMASQKAPAKKIPFLPSKITTQAYVLKVEKLDSGHTSTPWAIEFVDANKALLSEKAGKLRWLTNGSLDKEPISGLPNTFTKSGTSGFMDIALDPDYQRNGWVYLAYSHANGNLEDRNAPGMTKVVRGKINGHEWTDQQTVFEVPDSLFVTRGDRWGCRLLFDKEGFLYFSIGDMGKAAASQRLKYPTGKVFRIHPDGTIPKDNPFRDSVGALPAIYTIGNRNVQGLVQHPLTGDIWATEHGPRGGDELNILKKGGNYGWPLVTYGIDYSGGQVSEKTEHQGMEQPVVQWTPSIAVCPAEFVNGPQLNQWKHNLLVGALAFEELRRLVIVKNKVVKQEIILKGYGRVRDIKQSPDGSLYVLLNKPDMIVRLTPVEKRRTK